MRELLVITLLLGALASQAYAATPQRSGSFTFRDNRNKCWLCDANFHCEPCPYWLLSRNIPDDWPANCPQPTPVQCNEGTNLRFPSSDWSSYYQCGAGGESQLTQCPCDTLFNTASQSCVPTDDPAFFPRCLPPTNIEPQPCVETPPTEPPPTEPPPTVPPPTEPPPNGPTPTPPIPTAPTIPGETEPPPTDEPIDTTTNGNGNGNGNGTGTTTTPRPCVCVIWMPCPCNRCFHMPCQSCSGCPVGMGMGMGGGMGMWG